MRTAPLQSHELYRYGIPGTVGEFEQDWFRLEKLIQSALDESGNTHATSDVYEGIIHGRAFIFPGAQSVLITEFLTYPLKQVHNFWLAAGDMDELKASFKNATDFGKSMGVFEQEFKGRLGWHKIAKQYGWKQVQTVWTRDTRS